MSQDWFRKTTWTKSDEEDFLIRLKRTRSYNRSQYLRIQAFHLAESENPDLCKHALVLLDALFTEYPDRTELAMAYLQKAECLAVLDKIQEAVEYFKKAIDFEKEFPNVSTGAPLAFARYVIKKGLKDEFDQIQAIFAEFEPQNSTFPVQRFTIWGIRAVIAEESGRHSEAIIFAEKALVEAAAKSSGFRYHRKLGLVDVKNDPLYSRINGIVSKQFRIKKWFSN